MVRRINIVHNKPARTRKPESLGEIEDGGTFECQQVTRIERLERQFAEMHDRIAMLEAVPATREVVRVESTAIEKLPAREVERVDRIERALQKFMAAPDGGGVTAGLSELFDRISRLERTTGDTVVAPRDITPEAVPADMLERLEAVEEFATSFDDLNGRQVSSLQLIHDLMEMVFSNRKTADGQIAAVRQDVRSVKNEIVLVTQAIREATA